MIHSTTDFINHTEWNQMTGTEDIVVEKKWSLDERFSEETNIK